jgi:hypothetical protein|tara:strand:- start:1235 stop:1366 length:132 start_codon:yes stop_codon:yes gene_type:complete
MTETEVEKWDVRFDRREDATVVLEVGEKRDRARTLWPADGGAV